MPLPHLAAAIAMDARHEPVAAWLALQLEDVVHVFDNQLASELPAVDRLCRHVENYRGKMLRPTLVLLSGLAAAGGDPRRAAASGVDRRHVVVGAVVEMIHMATLVHDDVLDDAEVRRRGDTVNHLWGNEAAVMLGDYLISNSFHLCSKLNDPAINLALGEVTNTLCAGELIQLHHRDDLSLDEPTYFTVVERKTASLIAECCRLGVQLARPDDPGLADAMHEFGRILGVAFQIQDDLLDLTGEEDVVGKSLGRDLEKGKLTLPVIRHLAAVDADARGETLRAIRDRDHEALGAALEHSGAIDSARAAATDLVASAKELLPKLPESAARDLLDLMADAVVQRRR